MATDGLEELLSAWGDALTGRHEDQVLSLGKTPDVHILAKARRFAPGTTENFKAKLVGRDGRSRRTFMAQAQQAGARMRVVPMWAVDPVRATETRRSGLCNYAADKGLPPHLMRIDRLAVELYRADHLAWVCLRMQYTHRCGHAQKATYASEAAKQPLTLRQYREHLRRGRDWMRIRMYVDTPVTDMYVYATAE